MSVSVLSWMSEELSKAGARTLLRVGGMLSSVTPFPFSAAVSLLEFMVRNL